jgi:hypothetical protein
MTSFVTAEQKTLACFRTVAGTGMQPTAKKMKLYTTSNSGLISCW